MQADYQVKITENVELNQKIVSLNSEIGSLNEKNSALGREIIIKTNQVQEFDNRLQKSQDDLDLIQYKLQDQMKEMSGM